MRVYACRCGYETGDLAALGRHIQQWDNDAWQQQADVPHPGHGEVDVTLHDLEEWFRYQAAKRSARDRVLAVMPDDGAA
jgi:hypothetical protein